MLYAVVRRVLGIVSMVVVSLILAVAVGVSVVPRAMGWDLMTVLSGSMEPNLHVGALVIVAPVTPDDIRTGDVITFTVEDHRVSHRVVKVDGTPGARSFVTKGDANRTIDTETVPQAAVVGRVRGSIPLGGFALEKIRSPLGMAVLFGVIAWLLISSMFRTKKPVGADIPEKEPAEQAVS